MAEHERVVVGRLVLDDRVEPGRITVADGFITAVEPDESAAAGPIVAPGFVDMHVHGWGGHDAMGTAADLDGMARVLLRHGVTAFVPTAVTASLEALAAFAEMVRAWMPAAPADGAEPLGFSLEGPFIAVEKKGAQNPAFIRAPDSVRREDLEPLLDSLRNITIAPEQPGALDLVEWLAGHGVAVSLGHSVATVEQGRAGYRAGARSTTHLFNAMIGLDHRAPGLAAAALVEDDAYVEFVADGYHVHESLWQIVIRAKPAGRFVLVSDAVAPAGTPPGPATLGGLAVDNRGDRMTLAGTETLAGSAIALDTAVRNVVRAGVPLPVAVAAASRNPLELLRVTDRGRLAPGQRADLVLLDDDLRVRQVMRAGADWIAGAG